MIRTIRTLLPIALIGTTASLPAQVLLVAEWNFNQYLTTSTTNGFGDTIAANNGIGLLTVQSATTTGTNFDRSEGGGTTVGAWNSAPSGGSITLRRGERWNNGYLDLSFSMSNLTDVNLSFAGNITSTFPTSTTLQWSSNGGTTFTDFETLTQAADSPTNTLTLFSYQSSDVNYDFSALNNQSDVVIRFQFSGGGGAGSSGAGFVLDNIVLTATAIPEPSTYAAIFGLFALAGVCLRRRRK